MSTFYLCFSHQKVPKILKRNVQKEKKQKERLEKKVPTTYCFVVNFCVRDNNRKGYDVFNLGTNRLHSF